MSEESKVQDLKLWIENEAEFHGRTDNDFLLMFLRSCNFDLNLTKKTLVLYYQNRIKFPQWWANRSVDKLRHFMDLKAGTILIDKNPEWPTIAIVKLGCFGSDPAIFNDLAKLFSIGVELLVRRSNCQRNGFVVINDCQDYSTRFFYKLLYPSTIINLITSYIHAMPITITENTKDIFINTPRLASYIYQLCHPFLGKFGEKVHFLGSDLSKLGELVPLEMLPEEYGGPAGAFDQHHDAFCKEIQEFNDYLIEDEKYGFVTSVEEK